VIVSPGAKRGRLARLAVALAFALGVLGSPGSALQVHANDCNGVSFATSDQATTNEDAAVPIPAFANDLCVDGVTSVTVQIVTGPAHGTLSYISFSGDIIYYVPTANYAGPDSFQYRFWSVEYPDWSTGTVSITVNAVNDHPSVVFGFTSDCYPSLEPTVAEDSGPYAHDCSLLLKPGGGADETGQTVSIVVTGYDASLFSVPPHFDSTGKFGFTPAPNANGHTLFTWYAKDNGGTANGGVDTDPTHYSGYISITPVDDAPVAKADTYVARPGVSTTIPAPGVLANDTDVDGPALSAHLASLPAHGTLDLLASGSFSYRPDAGFSGSDSFTYTASDGSLSSAAAKVTLTVFAAATSAPPTAPPATAGPVATANPSGDVVGGATSAPAATTPEATTLPAGTAAAPSSAAGTGAPDIGPTGNAGGTDLTPIVLAIVVAGLLIGLGLVAGAVILRRRTGGTP
jgi:hypothetical protein